MGWEQKDDSQVDDDLTNLTWLQDQNLLRRMTSPADPQKTPDENLVPFLNGCQAENLAEKGLMGQSVVCSVPPVAYNPNVHIHAKPPYSFSCLIFMAIEGSESKALPVKEIYSWITDHFPYYRSAPAGWKNTVRHNLSLNKCFRKVDKIQDNHLSHHSVSILIFSYHRLPFLAINCCYSNPLNPLFITFNSLPVLFWLNATEI